MMQEDDKPNSRRRHLIKVALGAGMPLFTGGTILNAIGTQIGNTLGGSAAKRVQHALDKEWPEAKELPGKLVEDARELLFGDGRYKVLPSTYNPYAENSGGLTRPSATVIQYLHKFLESQGEHVVLCDDLNSLDYSGNLLLVGGPFANPQVKMIMGDRGISELFPLADQTILRFPFFLDISSSLSRMKEGIYREGPDAEGNISRVPAWHLADGQHLIAPTMRNHRLVADLILVTSIPNILDISSFEEGCRIFIFSPCHGVGNTAMRHLICDQGLVSRLLGLHHGENGWQAVLVADELSADSSDAYRLDPKILKWVPIRAPFESLARARAALSPRAFRS